MKPTPYRKLFLLSISLFLIFAALVQVNWGYGQQPIMKFTTITALENISNNKTSSIIQDEAGNLWIGSDDGLFRFDGQTVYPYEGDLNDAKSLPSGKINTLFIDSSKKLWICTSEGICQYNPEYDNFNRMIIPSDLKGLPGASIDVICEDRFGQIYVAFGSSFYKYDRKQELFACLVKLNQGKITAMTFDSHNNVWIAANLNGGLFYYDQKNQKIKIFKNEPQNKNSIANNEITDLALVGQNLWLATYGNGIDIYQVDKDSFKHYVSPEYYENFARRIFVGRKKDIWICTLSNLKLYNCVDDNFYNYYNQPNNPNSVGKGLIDFYEDIQGNFWTLYSIGEIKVVRKRNKFNHFDTQTEHFWHTIERNITAVVNDASGNLWIGNYYNGIDVFNWDKHTIDRYSSTDKKPKSVGGGTVFCIFCDSKKQMWVGSYFGGLQKFNPKSKNFTSYTNDYFEPTSIANNDVRSISEDKFGNLWVAVHGFGVDYFDQKQRTFRHFNSKNNKLCNDFTFQVLNDTVGNLWVATANGLGYLAQGDTIFKNYFFDQSDTTSMNDNEIHSLHIDNNQNLWVGTSSGLNQFDARTNSFIRYSAGLRNKNIAGILSDRKNEIWVSTYGGISKLNKENKTFITFDQSDGLISREFYDRACFRNRQNELFFGGSEGLDVFNPDSLIIEMKRPIVYLTDFRLLNKSITYKTNPEIINKHISQASEIRLNYKNNSFSILYQTIALVNPDKISYAYRLDGFDRDWINAANRTEANYTNLAPGNYKFRVRAKYDKGDWSEKETSIEIHIIPALWMRTWVKVLFSLVVMFIIFGVVSIRMRELRVQKLKLEYQVAERTNEIVEKNDLLESQTQTLIEKNDQLKDLNSTKDKLFSIISHDLRSPFNTILGFGELLLDSYSDLTDDERKNMISQLYNTSNQTYYLVENMLNWARIQTRNIKYEPKKIDLKEFFDAKFDLYEKIAGSKGIVLQSLLGADLFVNTDVNFLETILRNLINNAIKFTPAGGTIQVTAKPGPKEVVISVKDSGIGMTKNQIDNLFNINKNTYTAGTNGEKGSGLGLILCKEFIEEYNGTITVESAPGKGSTFSFTVPSTTIS
jgi:signal transduction histidine kinase/ligand-binding sensor domain-containing protein